VSTSRPAVTASRTADQVTVRHHLQLSGARTLRTTPLALTERAVRDLASARAMGVIHGPAGCGKTFAWQSATTLLDVSVCALQFPSRPSMLRVARVLLQQLTGRTPKGNRFDLSDELLDLLAERDRLIVIDGGRILADGPRDEVLGRLADATKKEVAK